MEECLKVGKWEWPGITVNVHESMHKNYERMGVGNSAQTMSVREQFERHSMAQAATSQKGMRESSSLK